MTSCAMTRWHPFNRAAAAPRSCVLHSRHSGLCRDGWGGPFEQTDPRALALFPDQVDGCNHTTWVNYVDNFPACDVSTYTSPANHSDAHRGTEGDRAGPSHVRGSRCYRPRGRLPCVAEQGHQDQQRNAFGGTWQNEADANAAQPYAYGSESFEVAACPVNGCALLAGHSGEHMDLDAREWAGAKGHDMTTDEGHTRGAALPADAMAAQMSRLLATPGLPVRSVATLRRADGAFNVLDGLMRSGAALPRDWHVDEDAEKDEAQYVTEVYDGLSEALREEGSIPQSFAALRSACAHWKALNDALRIGAPLPEPWRR